MAIMIPNKVPKSANDGEAKIYGLLERYLPENYMVWAELNIKGQYPDFVIVGPDLGVMVLEVKEWDLNYIKKIRKNEVELNDGTTKTSPLEQSRKYCMTVLNELKRSYKFYKEKEKDFKKDLIEFPCNHAVIFPNIYEAEFRQNITKVDVLDPQYVLFGDEINEIIRTGAENKLVEKLKMMRQYDFNGDFYVSSDKMREIRSVLYPEVILNKNDDEIIRTMDMQQEQLSKGMSYGNVIIKGVAGSGKTVILTSRAKYLAKKHPDWNILVVCYNVVLANTLRREYFSNVTNVKIAHFHGFFDEQCKSLGIKYDKSKRGIEEAIIELTSDYYDMLDHYDAILVDEGQDFEKSWLEFLIKLIKVTPNKHFLLTSDGAQNVYGREYFLSELGVQTEEIDILHNNYRNTEQILMFAYEFLTDEVEIPIDKSTDKLNNNFTVDPKRNYRKGPIPIITRCDDFEEEIRKIIDKIKELNDRGIELGEIAISATKNEDVDKLIMEINKTMNLKALKIRGENEKNTEEEAVKVSTLHSIKGLDYSVVIICGLNDFPQEKGSIKTWEMWMKKAVYVGLTRAKDEVYIYYSKENLFTTTLERARKLVVQSKSLFNKGQEAIESEWHRIEEELIAIEDKKNEIRFESRRIKELKTQLESEMRFIHSEKMSLQNKNRELEKKSEILKNSESDVKAEGKRLQNWHNQLSTMEHKINKIGRKKSSKGVVRFLKRMVTWGLVILALVFSIDKNRSDLADIFSQSESYSVLAQMQLIVGDYPKGYKGTYIEVSSQNDKGISDIFTKGTKIEFFSDKRVIVTYPDLNTKEITFKNDKVKVEVANNFTEIKHKDETYKERLIFDYDFEKNSMIKKE